MPETHQSVIIQADASEPAALVPEVTSKTYARKSTFLILFVALLLNAAIVLVGLPKVSSSLTLTYSLNFGDLYDLIAKNLEQGNGYRVDATTGLTMLREPLYPLLLAVVFKLAGYGIQTARVSTANAVISAAAGILYRNMPRAPREPLICRTDSALLLRAGKNGP